MSQSPQPERISIENEQSIRTLSRAITYSQGEFSLILARCNYASLREGMMLKLRQQCAIEIRELELSPDSKTLYTAIANEIGESHPSALVVFGLEAVQDVDTVLASTNQVREEFRKAFAFPLVLWINDTILKKLIKQVPDLESWASVVEFEMPPNDLTTFLQASVDEIFEELLDVGAAPFLSKHLRTLRGNSRLSSEIALAQQDIQHQEIQLNPALIASLEFLNGLAAASLIDESRQHYEKSLNLWPSGEYPERLGCVLYQLGLWWRTLSVKRRSEAETYCLRAVQYYQQAIAVFESANRPNLVAKFINPLGETLQRLEAWDDLKPIALKSLALNEAQANLYRQAEASGLLADALLGGFAWSEAKQKAEQALKLLEMAIETDPVPYSDERRDYINWQKSFSRAWYLFALGKAQWHLDQRQDAIQTLETARQKIIPEYDPPLFIQLLRTLRHYYFEQKEYLRAFEVRLEYRSVEQQYGFRAFVGAGRLQPRRESMNPALVHISSTQRDQVSQEIEASGRQEGVNRLIDRISRADQKLIVLHGQSGVGKSSIIQAGLIPSLTPITLDTRQVITILQQVYTNWTKRLGEEMLETLRSFGVASLPEAMDSSPVILEHLRKSVDQNLMVVLIFDQFEEFFFVHREPVERKPFYDFLKQCLNIPYVKVILSLREDYLHYLLECNYRLVDLDVIGNNILDKNILFYLGNFSRQEAKSIISSLTSNTPYPLDENLTNALVKDLSEELGEVRPIELQVVGAQLQTEQITTLEEYQEKGPKDSLVGRYLDEVTHDCGPENEDIARLVLYLLTDENNTRPLKTREDIELEINVAGKLDLILTILVKSGLVFRIPSSPSDRYQLVHDYLVIFVRQTQSTQLIAELEREREQRQLTEKQLNEALQKQLKTARRAAFTLTGLVTAITGVALIAFMAFLNTSVAGRNAVSKTNEEVERVASALKTGRFLHQWSPAVIHEIHLATLAELNQATNNARLINRIEAHTDEITMVSFSPDGQSIASSSRDKTVKVWRQDGSLATTLEHPEAVSVVRFNPDSTQIVTGDENGLIRAWNIETKQIIQTFKGHTANITDIQFSPDGSQIASSGDDTNVLIWNTSGKLLKKLEGHETEVSGICFSPDGNLLASFAEYDPVRIWNLQDLSLAKTLDETYQIIDVQFTKDSQTLAVTSSNTSRISYSVSGEILSGNGINAKFFPPRIEQYATLANSNVVAYLNKRNEPNIIAFTLFEPSRIDWETVPYLQHKESVLNFDVSPDGKRLVSISENNRLYFWDVSLIPNEVKDINARSAENISISGYVAKQGSMILQHRSTSTENSNPYTNFSKINASHSVYSPDPSGQYLIGVKSQAKNTVWNLDGEKTELVNNDSSITSAHFIVENQILATGSLDGSVRLWNLRGELIDEIGQHPNTVTYLTANHQGDRFASIDKHNINIWRADGHLLSRVRLSGEGKEWRHVIFSPNGNFLITLDNQGQASLRTKDGVLIRELKGHTGPIGRIDFSADSTKLLTISYDVYRAEVNIWDTNGSLIQNFDDLRSGNIEFLPDSKNLIYRNFYGNFEIINLGGSVQKIFRGHLDSINSIRISSDGTKIITAGRDNTIRVWSTTSGETIEVLRGHENSVEGIALSPDEKTIASIDSEGIIKLWNATNGLLLKTFEEQKNLYQRRSGYYYSLKSISFSPNGEMILASDGKRVTFLDKDGNILYRLWGNELPNFFWFFDSAPSGNAFVSQESALSLWNRDGKLLSSFVGHIDQVNSISFSPNGKRFASASTDKTVRIWNMEDGSSTTIEHKDKVNSVSFSSDGQFVATGSDDAIVRVWDLSGNLIQELDRHTDNVTGVLFSPDGKYLASSSIDNTIRLWNVSTWQEEKRFDIPAGLDNTELDALGFSSDGNLLSYGTDEIYVRLLNRRLFGGIWMKDAIFHPIKDIPEGGFPDEKHWLTVKGNKGIIILSLGLDHSLKEACERVVDYLHVNDNKDDDWLCDEFLVRN